MLDRAGEEGWWSWFLGVMETFYGDMASYFGRWGEAEFIGVCFVVVIGVYGVSVIFNWPKQARLKAERRWRLKQEESDLVEDEDASDSGGNGERLRKE